MKALAVLLAVALFTPGAWAQTTSPGDAGAQGDTPRRQVAPRKIPEPVGSARKSAPETGAEGARAAPEQGPVDPAGSVAEPQVELLLETDTVVPGQATTLRLSVVVPTYMPQPPGLPSYDVPNLMVRLPAKSTTPISKQVGGETWSGVQRRYILAPLIPGQITLPAQTIAVVYADPDTGQPRTVDVMTPPATLTGEVPEGAEGLDPFIAAKDLQITQSIEGETAGIEPGSAVVRRIEVSIDGATPLVLPPLLGPGPASGLAVYPGESVVEMASDRGGFAGRRTEEVTYMAEGGGRYQLPQIAVEWFNLESGQVETARVDGLEITVNGPAPVVDGSAPPGWRSMALALALALAGVAALALILWRLWPVFGARRRAHREAYLASEDWAYRHVLRQIARRDYGAAVQACDLWWRRLTEGSGFTPEMTGALLTLGRARFGAATPDAAAWKDLHRAVAAARMAARRRRQRGEPTLGPLNPYARSVMVLLTLSSVLLLSPGPVGLAQGQAAPDGLGYVGSQKCGACHEDAMADWGRSHHAAAWTPPTADHVLGDFDGSRFTHDDVIYDFLRDGDAYVIAETRPSGASRYPVIGVAGVAPLQQYIVEAAPGRYQSHDVVWDVGKARWYHLYPDQRLPHDNGLHWSGPYKNWNARCAECHATGFEKRYDPATRRYDSDQAEIGVGCEACHGPGAAHLAWVEGRATASDAPELAGFPLRFGDDPEVEIQQCAGCHSRREPFLDGNPPPGTPFHDAYRLSLLRPGLYHADGSIQDEVYVYGSFLQSRMYAQGVRCSDCHNPHSGALLAQDNALCTQCHNPAGNPRFATLKAGLYDDPAHHFHQPGTPGAACKSCHMIERDYMGIDGRRDHSFRIPRPDLSDETGAPDACTDCHVDRDTRWAAARLAEQFPRSPHRGAHFSQVIAAGRFDPGAAADRLVALANDPSAAPIVRATALELLGSSATPETAAGTAPLLAHENPIIRQAAIAAQRGAAPAERFRAFSPLLEDPVMAVRIAAARAFLDLPTDRLPPADQAKLGRAYGEWQGTLRRRADFPETHMVLGGTALVLRNMAAAEQAFREAVTLDPQLTRAWSMIVRIRHALGDLDGARQALQEAVALNPGNFDLLSLGSLVETPGVRQ
ncbi:MAG: tetratricopeptide repeat protein [Pseudomonadota bacterium]